MCFFVWDRDSICLILLEVFVAIYYFEVSRGLNRICHFEVFRGLDSISHLGMSRFRLAFDSCSVYKGSVRI